MKKYILSKYTRETETKPKKICTPPTRYSERLCIKNFKLPFEKLPTECKLHVFSYLTVQEKGGAAQVCREWNTLLSCSSAWQFVALSDFNKLQPQPSRTVPKMFQLAAQYNVYCKKVTQFMTFLGDIHPSLRHLEFQFDIGRPQDPWLEALMTLLADSRCQRLSVVKMDWATTPMRPSKLDSYCCVFNKVCVMYRRHQTRAQASAQLLEQLAKVAPNLAALEMPFSWTPRSVLLLSRLKHLERLTLGKYVTLRSVDQDLLDALLKSLQGLQYLHMQICMPLYHKRTLFSLSHSQLEVLDLTGSSGFFLKKIHTPSLHTLRLSRSKWGGRQVTQGSNIVPCLYTVVREGAPELELINKCQLQDYWREYPYDMLNNLLEGVCSCKSHYNYK